MEVSIAALYRFAPLPDFRARREPLLAYLKEHGIKGTVLLASEGINGTLSGSREALDALLAHLRSWPDFSELQAKFSTHPYPPFARSKVKLKKELISLGEPADPSRRTGVYVKPKDWNALISRPEVTLVDARNDYEYYIGRFTGAMNPNTRTFKQMTGFTRGRLDALKNKKVAAYCTGGIRCEKYTAWLKGQGFEEVYHLEGGILQYLEDVPPEQSLWEGDCYVFDGRIAVGHGLVPNTEVTECPGCGHPLKAADRDHPEYVAGSSCLYCATAVPSNADTLPDPLRYAKPGHPLPPPR